MATHRAGSAGLACAPSRPLAAETADYLRDLIFQGVLEAGEFLRPERFAAELRTSITPVREALMALRADGLVRLVPRRGFVVLPLTRQDLLDLAWAQAQIVGELTARATLAMSEDDLAELRRLHEELAAAIRCGDESLVEARSDGFHAMINRAAGPTKLGWLASLPLHNLPRRFRAALPERWSGVIDEHERLVVAMTERRVEDARRIMIEHHLATGEALAALVDRVRRARDAAGEP